MRENQDALFVRLLDEDELYFFVDEFGLEGLHGLSALARRAPFLPRI